MYLFMYYTKREGHYPKDILVFKNFLQRFRDEKVGLDMFFTFSPSINFVESMLYPNFTMGKQH